MDGNSSHERTVLHVRSDSRVLVVHLYQPAAPRTMGVPVLLLPGLFGDEFFWQSTVQALLNRGDTVITMRDPIALIDSSISKLRGHMAAIIDALPYPKVVLSGNSLGGLVAIDLAATFPDRVSSLLISGVPGLNNEYDLDFGSRLTYVPDVPYRLARLIVYNDSRLTPEVIEHAIPVFEDRRALRTMVMAIRAARKYDVTTALAKITCPVLLVWGENDRLTAAAPWESHIHLLKHGALRIIPECGHAPMFECPDQFNALLFEFLEQR